jgi:hypothetical protein
MAGLRGVIRRGLAIRRPLVAWPYWRIRALRRGGVAWSEITSERRIAELRRSMLDLPHSRGEMPLWAKQRAELRQLAERRDPRRFLTWPCVVNMMVVGNTALAREEFSALRDDSDWQRRWKPAIREDPVGLPVPFPRYPGTSATLIHHTYHVQRFERATGLRVPDLAWVIEFGGGYGSLARLFHRLGFRGRYHLHDLPEWSALQRFFLSSALGAEGSFTFSADLAEARKITDLPGHGLFVATWSLSETPLTLRNEWLRILDRLQIFLLGYQHEFHGVDNRMWFSELQQRRPDLTWTQEEIRHIPGNAYLFGRP